MSGVYIYGLRLRGSPEVRYVGQTAHDPDTRLRKQTTDARRSNYRGALCKWLRDNEGNTEAFKIGKVETRAEAHAMERTIVALCLRLNHRLLNTWLVPADCRQIEEGIAA